MRCYSGVTLGEFFPAPMPQFSHLYNEGVQRVLKFYFRSRISQTKYQYVKMLKCNLNKELQQINKKKDNHDRFVLVTLISTPRFTPCAL